MAIRLTRMEQNAKSGVGAARSVQFGEAYLCELPESEIGKAGVGPRIVVVVQSMELCKNAAAVYVAPVAECEAESAFSFRIEAFNGDGIPEGAGIDLTGIGMMGAGKMRVRLGRLGARDLWRLDKRSKEMFGTGGWEGE